MATNFVMGTAGINGMADAIDVVIDQGTGAGVLNIYTGSQPANPQTSTTGTLAVSPAFQSPPFGAAAAGVITLQGTPSEAIAGGGPHTVAWFRISDSDDTPATAGQMDGTVGTATSDLIVNNTSFGSSDTFTLDTFTITVPAV